MQEIKFRSRAGNTIQKSCGKFKYNSEVVRGTKFRSRAGNEIRKSCILAREELVLINGPNRNDALKVADWVEEIFKICLGDRPPTCHLSLKNSGGMLTVVTECWLRFLLFTPLWKLKSINRSQSGLSSFLLV